MVLTSEWLFIDFLVVFLAPHLKQVLSTVVILLDLGGNRHKDGAVLHVLVVETS